MSQKLLAFTFNYRTSNFKTMILQRRKKFQRHYHISRKPKYQVFHTYRNIFTKKYRYIIAEQPHTRQQGNPLFSSFYRILKAWSLLLFEPSRSPLRSTLTHVRTETPSMSEFQGTRTSYELVIISMITDIDDTY